MKTLLTYLFLSLSLSGHAHLSDMPDDFGTVRPEAQQWRITLPALPPVALEESLATPKMGGGVTGVTFGNGQGLMFDIQVKGFNLSVKRFDMHFYTYKETRRVYFYYKEGTYWGAESEPMEWILHDSVDVFMSGPDYSNNVYLPVVLNKPIPLQAGKIYGINITFADMTYPGSLWSCTGQPPVSDSWLTIFPGTMHENERFLTDNQSVSDRKDGYMFSGTIHYDYSFGCPEDFVLNNDPGECGAQVNFPSLTSGDGLKSGDVFPVGTTPVSVTVTDTKNNITYTCNRDVMISDTEKPNFGFGEIGPIRADFYDGISFNKYMAFDGYDLAMFAWKYAETVPAINFNWGTSFPRADLLGTQYFSVRFTSKFTAPVAGTYTFRTVTDDGVRLYLNNTLKIDQWRLMNNGSFICTIDLAEGETIPVVMEYYAYYVKAEAYLFYTCPGGPEKIFATVPKVYSDKVVNADGCTYMVQEDEFDPTAGDNCPFTLSNDYNQASTLAGAGFPAGTTRVEWTATDTGGNTSTISYTITVNENQPPVAICKDITAQLDASGQISIDENAVDNGSSDACGSVTFDTDKTTFTCSDLGKNQVVLTVTDTWGNSASCTAMVDVRDLVPPSLHLNDYCVFLTEQGKWTLNAYDMAQIVAGSTDNCTDAAHLSYQFSRRSFDCNDVYLPKVNVKVSVTDASGNIASGTFGLMVMDTISPVAKCRNVEMELDAFGQALVVPGYANEGGDRENVPEWAKYYKDLEGGSYDNCGIAEMYLSQGIFTRDNVGVNDVVLTVVDPSGNTAWCQATVIITDPFDSEIETPALPGNEETLVSPNSPPTLDEITNVELIGARSSLEVSLRNITPGPEPGQKIQITVSTDHPELIASMEIIHTNGSASGMLKITFAPGVTGEAMVTITLKDDGGILNGGVDTTVKNFKVKINEEDKEEEQAIGIDIPEENNVITSSADLRGGEGYKIYPNPTRGRVTIEWAGSAPGRREIRVYSILGHEVIHDTYSAGSEIILDLTGNAPGLYLVRLTAEGSSYVSKVLLNNH